MKTVERALEALEVLARMPEGLSLTEASDRLREAVPTTHRLLSTLARAGFAAQDPESKRYGLGPAILRLAQSYERQNDLARVAQLVLDDLTEQTQESSFVTQQVGGAAIVVAKADSPHALRFYMGLGQRMPYHAAASARAILAYTEPSVADELLMAEGLEAYTTVTPTTLAAARAELARVREQGFAVCNEELEVGVTALSVPVLNARGGVAASVTVVAPGHRLLDDQQTRVLALLKAAGRRIAEAIGLDGSVARTYYALGPEVQGTRR
jgi:DNA-binding IclR family transcriptional regulator